MSKLTIDLNCIHNPNPAMLKEFKDNNAMDLFNEHIPSYVNEKRCFNAAAASNKLLKHSITHLYRVQTKDGKEWCYMGNEIYARDYFNNVVMHYRQIGKWTKPVFAKTMGLSPGMLKDNTDINKALEAQTKWIEIDHEEIVYEYPWEDIKPILEKWKSEGVITDEVQLVAISGSQKYSKPYSFYEFLNLDFSDLVLISRAGRSLEIRDKDLTTEVLGKLRSKLNDQAIEQIGKVK